MKPLDTFKHNSVGSNSAVIYNANCLDVLAALPENSVDAIVCDPPYEINFMGRAWDRSGVAYDTKTWAACLRVLKPGGYLVAFAACRTSHRIACAIEDGGFEIRDTLQWVFGSGFPKSLDIAKALVEDQEYADVWGGYGTALKPAYEPIVLARKPLDGTVANNVKKWGTGGINVDGCRVGTSKRVPASASAATIRLYGDMPARRDTDSGFNPNVGRWPPNILLGDGAEEHLAEDVRPFFPSFCYTTKASRAEREAGVAESGLKPMSRGDLTGRDDDSPGLNNPRAATRASGDIYNTHTTVKPIEIMRWLVRLVSPPTSLGPIVLDPFCGSGTTGVAAMREGTRFIGVELDERHAAIAHARINEWYKSGNKRDAKKRPKLKRK